MTSASITVRKIENGFVVGDSHQDMMIGCSPSTERFFATFDELAATVPGIIESALAQAEEQRRKYEAELASEQAQYANQIRARGQRRLAGTLVGS